MKIRPEIISTVFSNLASAWFGLIFVTPVVLIGSTIEDTMLSVMRTVFEGIFCLYAAEYFARREDDEK